MSTSKNINRTNLSPKDALDLLAQGNKRFIENAPDNVVNNEKKKEADIKIKIKMLELKLKK